MLYSGTDPESYTTEYTLVLRRLSTTWVCTRHRAASQPLPIEEGLLHKKVKRFRGGLVFKAHRRFVSLNSRLESNKEEEV